MNVILNNIAHVMRNSLISGAGFWLATSFIFGDSVTEKSDSDMCLNASLLKDSVAFPNSLPSVEED